MRRSSCSWYSGEHGSFPPKEKKLNIIHHIDVRNELARTTSEVNNPTNNEMLLHSFHHFAALGKVEAIIMPRAIGRAVYLCARIHFYTSVQFLSSPPTPAGEALIGHTYTLSRSFSRPCRSPCRDRMTTVRYFTHSPTVLIPTHGRAPPKASETRRCPPSYPMAARPSPPPWGRWRCLVSVLELTGLSVYLRAAGLLHGRQ